jgi:dynactin complex subunit
MPDPNNLDDLAKVGVSAGSGGLVVALTTLVGRFLTSGKLDALTAEVVKLSAQMTVLLAASERRDSEHDRLDAVNRFASLEARMAALEKLVEREVHQ